MFREAELAALEELLTTSAPAGSTVSAKYAGLQGMGGVGKTSLAIALAWRLKDRYPDAQIFLKLHGADPARRPPVTPAEALQTVIRAFRPEAPLPDDVSALQAIYRSVLQEGERRCLLLLDDAAGPEQVEPLLPPPNCLLLVTSRRQFNLPGLTARNLDCLAPDKSLELLRKLAPRVEGHAAVAAELCGHLPLALGVFASAVNDKILFPVPELLARLRTRQDKLEKVDAAFAVSAELLEPELRRRWYLLSVFTASFDLEAAAAICGDSRDPDVPRSEPPQGGATTEGQSARESLQALVNASLVEWNESNGRFRLHDLARDFALRQLRAADHSGSQPSALDPQSEEFAARLRQAVHFRWVGSRMDELYQAGGGKVQEGLALFDRERGHLDAAFAFLEALTHPSGTLSTAERESIGTRGRAEACRQLVALVNAVVYTGGVRFHPHERIRWLQAQAAAAREIGDRRSEANALGNLGNAYDVLGDSRKATEFYEQALVTHRDIGDRGGEGSGLCNLGSAYLSLGDPRKAIELYEQALVIDRETGDRRSGGSTLGNLGIAYKNLGDARRAIELYEQALAIARETGDRRGEGGALGNLGNGYATLGEPRKAIQFYEQALVIASEIGDRLGVGNTLGNLGGAYADLGDAREAIGFYEQCRDIARWIGDLRGEGQALWNSALALDKLGRRAEATARAEGAMKLFEQTEHTSLAKVRAQLAQWRGGP